MRIRKNKYSSDYTYFNEIDSEDKAYFLGFMFADGYNDTNNKEIYLGTDKKDLDIIKKFKEVTISENPISFTRNICRIRISSKELSEDLEKYGCVKNKSLILKYPNNKLIPENFVKDFIRGYFDGDGCIYINKKVKNSRFSLIGTLDFLLVVQDKLVNNCNLSYTKIRKIGNVFELGYCGNKNIRKIKNYLYSSSTIYLERKKDKMFSI